MTEQNPSPGNDTDKSAAESMNRMLAANRDFAKMLTKAAQKDTGMKGRQAVLPASATDNLVHEAVRLEDLLWVLHDFCTTTGNVPDQVQSMLGLGHDMAKALTERIEWLLSRVAA